MTLYVCPVCRSRQSAVSIAARDVRDAARRLARSRSDDPQRLRDELADLKQTLRDRREFLEIHQAECTFEPEAARPVRGVRRKAVSKRPVNKVAANRAARVPDRSVLLAAIAAQPVVTLPQAPEVTDDGERSRRKDARNGKKGARNTGKITGRCHRCERDIPPGRRLCGRCLATGGKL